MKPSTLPEPDPGGATLNPPRARSRGRNPQPSQGPIQGGHSPRLPHGKIQWGNPTAPPRAHPVGNALNPPKGVSTGPHQGHTRATLQGRIQLGHPQPLSWGDSWGSFHPARGTYTLASREALPESTPQPSQGYIAGPFRALILGDTPSPKGPQNFFPASLGSVQSKKLFRSPHASIDPAPHMHAQHPLLLIRQIKGRKMLLLLLKHSCMHAQRT